MCKLKHCKIERHLEEAILAKSVKIHRKKIPSCPEKLRHQSCPLVSSKCVVFKIDEKPESGVTVKMSEDKHL